MERGWLPVVSKKKKTQKTQRIHPGHVPSPTNSEKDGTVDCTQALYVSQ